MGQSESSHWAAPARHETHCMPATPVKGRATQPERLGAAVDGSHGGAGGLYSWRCQVAQALRPNRADGNLRSRSICSEEYCNVLGTFPRPRSGTSLESLAEPAHSLCSVAKSPKQFAVELGKQCAAQPLPHAAQQSSSHKILCACFISRLTSFASELLPGAGAPQSHGQRPMAG